MYHTKLPYMQNCMSIWPLRAILQHFLREFAHFAPPFMKLPCLVRVKLLKIIAFVEFLVEIHLILADIVYCKLYNVGHSILKIEV